MRNAFGIRWSTAVVFAIVTGAVSSRADELRESPPPGPFAEALWLVQRFGVPEAASFRHDSSTKARLAKALNKQLALTEDGAARLMDAKKFSELAGGADRLDAERIEQILAADAPPSRKRLRPALAAHLQALTTSFDRIEARHREAGERLCDWIVEGYGSGKDLNVIFVCTGNSRRSMLGATMGNAAADYYGLSEIRCYSGGTAPSAFNRRAIAALKQVGLEIEPLGKSDAANPRYRVCWGDAGSAGEPEMETVEFSKYYGDAANPQKGFAAVMVCSEADEACPNVAGAAVRISAPFLDPKTYDDGAYETAKYAERRDDLGRLMLAVMMQARHRLAAAGKLP
jgi:hypothetical protein